MAMKGSLIYAGLLFLLYQAVALAFGEFGWSTMVSGIVALVIVFSVVRFGESLRRRLFPYSQEQVGPKKTLAPEASQAVDSTPWFRHVRILGLWAGLQPIIVAALVALIVGRNGMMVIGVGLVLGLLAALILALLWYFQRDALEARGFRW